MRQTVDKAGLKIMLLFEIILFSFTEFNSQNLKEDTL